MASNNAEHVAAAAAAAAGAKAAAATANAHLQNARLWSKAAEGAVAELNDRAENSRHLAHGRIALAKGQDQVCRDQAQTARLAAARAFAAVKSAEAGAAAAGAAAKQAVAAETAAQKALEALAAQKAAEDGADAEAAARNATAAVTTAALAAAAAKAAIPEPARDPDLREQALAALGRRLIALHDRPTAAPPPSIADLIDRGNGGKSQRTREAAEDLVPDFKLHLGITDQDKFDESKAVAFIITVLQSIGWYTSKISEALFLRNLLVIGTIALLVAIPIGIVWLPTTVVGGYAGNGIWPAMVAQLSAILTSIFGLQKVVNAWFTQQQRFAAWKGAADELKQLWYGLQADFKKDLAAAANPAPRVFPAPKLEQYLDDKCKTGGEIVAKEQRDFYSQLKMDDFNLATVLGEARTAASGLITGLIGAAPTQLTAAIASRAAEQLKARNDVEALPQEIQDLTAAIKDIDDEIAKAKPPNLTALQAARDARVKRKTDAEAALIKARSLL